MTKPFGKALHSKFLDQPWCIGLSFDNAVADCITDLLVMHLDAEIRWELCDLIAGGLRDIIYEKLLEEIRSNAI